MPKTKQLLKLHQQGISKVFIVLIGQSLPSAKKTLTVVRELLISTLICCFVAGCIDRPNWKIRPQGLNGYNKTIIRKDYTDHEYELEYK